MSKKKTITEVREEIAVTEKKAGQTENLIAEKIQQYSKLTRKARTRRLIERGAIVESFIDGADNFTNEQIQTLLRAALSTSAVYEMTAAFNVANEAVSADETLEIS